ncbi:type VI secretion system baseplate subunit TssE [Pseudomonas sp. NA-150]|uniref:type VI secretion system baseplate subunit TssE n=1 Tax=Pseudomonas sp. NA-150 TaxID=3367525 RepID=UPI0037CAE07B
MTAYGSLFERLGGETNKRSKSNREAATRASVAAHLAKMLSTRAGSVQTLPDYGLPDLNNMNMSLHDALISARDAIQNFIVAYEPRLSRVSVSSQPNDKDPLRLAFDIDALVEANGVKQPMRFSAVLNSGGQVGVE